MLEVYFGNLTTGHTTDIYEEVGKKNEDDELTNLK
jgi:hypothetical protein